MRAVFGGFLVVAGLALAAVDLSETQPEISRAEPQRTAEPGLSATGASMPPVPITVAQW